MPSLPQTKIVKTKKGDFLLQVLPDGDQTAIGDRGINLSGGFHRGIMWHHVASYHCFLHCFTGGQKQRVALARAVYANPVGRTDLLGLLPVSTHWFHHVP